VVRYRLKTPKEFEAAGWTPKFNGGWWAPDNSMNISSTMLQTATSQIVVDRLPVNREYGFLPVTHGGRDVTHSFYWTAEMFTPIDDDPLLELLA